MSKALQIQPASSSGFIGIDDIRLLEKQGQLLRHVFEHKLDGSRYLFHINQGSYHLTSRRESKHGGGYVDRIAQAYRLRDLRVLDSKAYGTVLDGEIMGPGGDHASVTSIIGSSPARARALQEQKGPLVYKIFDIVRLGGLDVTQQPFATRRAAAELVVKGLVKANNSAAEFLQMIDQHRVAESKAAEKLFLQSLSDGYEGLMVKRLDATYGNASWKWKVYRDACAIITGFEPGKGKYKGQVGAFKFSVYDNGSLKEVGQCSGMDDDVRRELSKQGDRLLGSIMEIRGQEMDVKGRVRHPRFQRIRTDINKRDCTWKKFEADMKKIAVV